MKTIRMITKGLRISIPYISSVLCRIGIVLTSLFFASSHNLQSQTINQTESDDLYSIIKNGKFGFIDSEGRVVIKPQFLMANSFSEGLTAVLIGNEQKQKTAFIDTKGRIVFETKDSPSEKGFSCGVAVLLADHSSDSYYIDKKGKWINGYYNHAEDCTEGLCAVRMQSMGPKHWGYINTSGVTIIKGQFDWAYPFSHGAARVCMMADDTNDDIATRAGECKIGFIDRTGTPITPINFDGASDFSEDLAQVKLGEKWGFINKTGDLVIARQYEESHAFKDGLAAVKVNGRWGFIDKSGAMIITPRFDSVEDFSEDWAAVKFAWRAFYVDRVGRTVLNTPFEKAGSFRNDRAIVGMNNKAGLIDKEGKIIFNLQSSSLEFISDELIRVQDRENGIGYINYSGEVIWKQTY